MADRRDEPEESPVRGEPRGFKAAKCFEGSGPFVIWSVAAPAGGRLHKFYLTADARQRSFGVRISSERSDDLKSGGSVVSLMRKHARTAGIGRIFRDPAAGHVWIPLFTTRGEQPDFWLQLAKTSPPELRFVGKDQVALIRKSSQGTYTKRRAIEEPLPAYPPGPEMEDLTGPLFATAAELGGEFGSEPGGGDEANTDETESPAETGPSFDAAQDIALPAYQVDARQRLARRLKTVRKSLAKLDHQAEDASSELTFQRQAELLRAFLHRVRPDAFELVLTPEETGLEAPVHLELDPEKTPGQNLEALYDRVKKARRAQTALAEQAAHTRREAAAMADDLERLRTGEMSLSSVEGVLRRYRLPLARQSAPVPGAHAAGSVPYRSYAWRPSDDAKPITLMVGKSAADSDELCKQAKGNDYWLHAVGTTGSHVIIPARQLAGAPDLALIRAGAILALHWSKLRDNQRGEVYFSRRQNIRKRKGMAPGLWQIDKAETLFFRYDDAELAQILSATEP